MSIEIFIEKNKECIICFDLIENKENIEIFKDCEHNNNYHNECINSWVNDCMDKNIIPSCPICRKELYLIEITNFSVEQNNHSQIIIQNDLHNVRRYYYYDIKQICCICTISIFLGMIALSLFNERH